MLRFLTILGLVASALGFPADERVIGGVDAPANTYVWQVSLQYPYGTGYWHFCGGSLISNSYVFTAAHCWQDPNEVVVTVYMGSTEKFSGGVRHAIDYFLPNSDYNSARISDDFAIIRLSQPADLSNAAIGVIALPSTQSTTVQYSGTGTVTGWGYYQYGPGVIDKLPDDLQVGYLPILSDAQCKSSWGFNYQSDCMVCAGAEGAGQGESICMGDSGGPFVTTVNGQTTLIGAVSWVESNCSPNYPSVFAKVAAARDWIFQITGI